MRGVIFIHGILPRSGTNLLNQVLLRHPDCVQPAVRIRENWFLPYTDNLYAYADQLFHRWSNPKWGGDAFSRPGFYSTIGNALLAYLGEGTPDVSHKVLLTKTPSVAHLERCFELFPESKLVIITRDPRDVAASTYKTWQRPVEQCLLDWNVACRAIYRFERATPSDRYLLVRFEDLVQAKEPVTQACLRFLQLEPERYPWDSLGDLPIFGSSEEASWQVKNARDTFQPITRWKALPGAQRDYLAGCRLPCAAYFGYPALPAPERPALPARDARLGRDDLFQDETQFTQPTPPAAASRWGALRTGVRLIAEALLGRRVVACARGRRRHGMMRP